MAGTMGACPWVRRPPQEAPPPAGAGTDVGALACRRAREHPPHQPLEAAARACGGAAVFYKLALIFCSPAGRAGAAAPRPPPARMRARACKEGRVFGAICRCSLLPDHASGKDGTWSHGLVLSRPTEWQREPRGEPHFCSCA